MDDEILSLDLRENSDCSGENPNSDPVSIIF